MVHAGVAAVRQHAASRVRAIALLLAVSLAMVWIPQLLGNVGADSDTYHYYMDCFARQFWQGDLYPRSCPNINGGLGAPIFLFYFPLSFWIASLFWPLTWAGLDLQHFYIWMTWLPVFASGLTCYRWLRPLMRHQAALAGALFYIIATPYFAELLLYLSAYAELWLMALLPCVFHSLRRMLDGPTPASVGALAFSWCLCLFAHAPCALIIGIGVLTYSLTACRRDLKKLLYTSAAFLLGTLGALVYMLPAIYYKQFIVPPAAQPPGQAIIYPSFYWLSHGFYIQGYMDCMASCGVLAVLLIFYQRSGRSCLAVDLREEVRRWLWVTALAIFLFFPVLKPLWLHYAGLQMVFFPWRMQLLWMPLIALLAGALTDQQRQRRVGDLAALAILTMLFSWTTMQTINPGQEEKISLLEKIQPLQLYEYRPVWLGAAYNTQAVAVLHYAHPRQAEAGSHATKVSVTEWQANRIVLQVDAAAADIITIYRRYFPNWQVHDPEVALRPSLGDDLMQLAMPAGARAIIITQDAYSDTPWWVRFSPYGSIAGLLAMLAIAIAPRRSLRFRASASLPKIL